MHFRLILINFKNLNKNLINDLRSKKFVKTIQEASKN